MKSSRIALLLSVLAACKGDTSGPVASGPALVTVSAPQTTLTVGSTVQLSATVYDQANQVLAVAVIWQSDNAGVASVSTSGLVSAVAEGATVIRATAGGKTGSVSISVNQDYCLNPLSLSPGQVKSLSGPAAVSCITLAATTGASDFLFIAANAAATQDNVGAFSVSLANAPAAMLSPAVLEDIDPRRIVARLADQYATTVEDRLRAQEVVVSRAVMSGPNRPSALANPQLSRSVVAAAAPRVGDTLSYRVPNVNATDLCTTYTTVRAAVKAVGTRGLVVQDVAAPSGGFTDTDFRDIAREFDDHIFLTDTAWFGSPTDRNADGLIVILYTPEVNKATPAGSVGFTAGFFWGGDLFRASEYPANRPCPQTNEQELFYALVPDPTGAINGNVRTTVTVRQNTRGVIAHEFQHMINNGIRMFKAGVTEFETAWLNEGLAHFAEEAVGRKERGFADMQSLGFLDVNPSAANQDDYNAFFRQNMARLRTWMQRPDTASPTSARARSQLAPRGAAWLLLRYAADQYGNSNPRAFMRRLVGGPEVDIANLVNKTGAQFDDIISGFLVATFADDYGVSGLGAKYSVPSWNLRDLMTSYNNGTFPLQVTALPGSITTQALSGSGTFFRVTRNASAPQTKFQMQAPGSGVPVAFDGARVFVLRLN